MTEREKNIINMHNHGQQLDLSLASKVFKGIAASVLLVAYAYSIIRWNDYYTDEEWTKRLAVVTGMYVVGIVAILWRNRISDRLNLVFSGVLFCMTPFLCYILVESANSPWSALLVEGRHLSMRLHMLNGMIFVCILLFFFFVSCSFRFASIATYIVSTLSGLLMYYVCMFRGTAFAASDLYSIGAGMDVALAYDYNPNFGAYLAISICLTGVAINSAFRGSLKVSKKTRAGMLLGGILVCGAFWGTYFRMDYTRHMKVKLFCPQNTYIKKGAMLSVVRSFSYLFPEKPDGYSVERAEEIAEKYRTSDNPKALYSGETPNLIMIMDESLCDVGAISPGVPGTNTALLPNMKSLQENTWRGTLHEERHGGGTAIFEYEVLSGNTNAFLPVGTIVYQTLIRGKSPSIASQLVKQGYQGVIASHPHTATNYNRDDAYPLLGFRETRFREDFDAAGNNQLYGNYISDKAAFQELIDEFETCHRESDAPFFAFQVTMQNHAPYVAAESREVRITNPAFKSEKVEQYMNYAQASDKAFGELVEYFQKVDDPTLIVLWGDHAPRFPKSYFKKLMNVEGGFSDEQEMYYNKTPFVMWANYKIEGKDLGDMTNNYLSSYIIDMLGLNETGYQRFLKDLHEEIPQINSIGYIDRNGKYYSLEDESSPYYDRIQEYRILEYNCLVDTEHRLDGFFD